MLGFLRKVYAVYGVLVFVIHLLLFIPFLFLGLFLFGQRSIRPLIWYAHHGIAGVTLFLSGIWFRTQGRELVRKKDGPFIIVSNHRSFLDILIDAVAFPGVYKFLSKKEMVKVPVFGVLVKRMCILVDRKSEESRHQSYENMKQALDEGFSVLLYPEGTRNRKPEEGRVKKFYDGAFRLASETGRPLAVVTLNDPGLHNDPVREFDLWPGWIKVTWGLISDTKGRDVEDLKEETREIMLSNF
jgi:1-acyl-sn-glycerol-3-phosphate acyltransferase